jgi:iron(III) transport system permease protein
VSRRAYSSFLSATFVACVLAWLWAPFALLLLRSTRAAWEKPEVMLWAWPARGAARTMLFSTLQLVALTAFFALALGGVCAVALSRGPGWWRNAASIWTVWPLALPPTLGATAFLEWSRTPPLRSLASLGAQSPLPVPPVLVAALVLAACSLPLVAIPLALARGSVPPESDDAARLLGGGAQRWSQVLAPLLSPTVWAGCGAVAALAMWEMGAADLLDVRTYAVQVYRDLSAADALDAGEKSVRAFWSSLPLMLLLGLALLPLARGRVPFLSSSNSFRPKPLSPLVLLGALAAWALASLAPVAVFAGQSRGSVLATVWSANAVEIGNTLLLSSVGALLIVALSLGLCFAWRHWPSRWRIFVRTALGCLALFSPVVSGVALVEWYNQPAFDWLHGDAPLTGSAILDSTSAWLGRYGLMLIGYATRFVPIAAWLLDARLSSLESQGEEAARGLGASTWRSSVDIAWPSLRPFACGVGVLAWSGCAGELSQSVLINAPGGQTLPLPIFNLMHIGATAEVAALALILIGMNACVAILGLWLARGSRG